MCMRIPLYPLRLTEDSLKCGHTSFEDDPQVGWPETVATLKTIVKEHDIVLHNKQGKVIEILMWEYQKKGCKTSCTKN
ncbi:hypothetical protein TNIN_398441 [Trichonephila inaurata madagascariensis]|uniref:Uncharacterized protein n=1 Tax=Trichonephila inaurata madagascariensis TaxID=2747483 RepID=A0A8X6WQS8_9ARAC|nr:hypothetical protein TNIN_398441 [Trichonephila inaurata madagascariensis]